MDNIDIRIVELPPFEKKARKIFNKDELADLKTHIRSNPKCGDVIPGTGGLRKVRWGIGNKGKRGGTRVIYFYHLIGSMVYLMVCYTKNDQADISASVKKQLKTIVNIIKKRRLLMVRPKKQGTESYTELEKDLLEAANAMLAIETAEHSDQKTTNAVYAIPDHVNVQNIRSDLHLTQRQFASITGASVSAIRHWENGRRKPDGTARALLHVLHQNPKAVLDALGNHPEA